jgi:hypothetical protein
MKYSGKSEGFIVKLHLNWTTDFNKIEVKIV